MCLNINLLNNNHVNCIANKTVNIFKLNVKTAGKSYNMTKIII